jgi:hypothetical protein
MRRCHGRSGKQLSSLQLSRVGLSTRTAAAERKQQGRAPFLPVSGRTCPSLSAGRCYRASEKTAPTSHRKPGNVGSLKACRSHLPREPLINSAAP